MTHTEPSQCVLTKTLNDQYVTGVERLALLAAIGFGCGPSVRNAPDGTACVEGAKQCAGNALRVCHDGAFAAAMPCAEACSESLGCVECAPEAAAASCSGGVSHYCTSSGSYADETCDPLQ